MDRNCSKNLRLLQININGCSERSVFALNKYANERAADIICISETKVGNDCDRFTLDNFTKMSKANQDHRSGGVALLVHHSIASDRVEELERPSVDVIVAVVTVKNNRFLFCSVYCPPNNVQKFRETLKLLKQVDKQRDFYRCSATIIMGDLNARHFNWNDKICNLAGKELVDFCALHDLSVANTLCENTFICKEGGSVINILIISSAFINLLNGQSTDEDVELFSGAPMRGHVPVWTELAIQTNPAKMFTKLCWDKTDWPKYRQVLDQESINIIPRAQLESDPKLIWDIVLRMLIKVRNELVPKKIISTHSKPYWNSQLSELSKTLRTARNEFKYRSTYHNGDKLEQAKTAFSDGLL